MRISRTLFLALACVLGLLVPASESSAGDHDAVELVDGWLYQWGDSPVGPDGVFEWLRDSGDDLGWQITARPHNIDGRGGHRVLWLRARIPENDWVSPTLFVPPVHMAFEVYVGTRRVYRDGEFEPRASKYAHVNTHLVGLQDDCGGQLLTLRIYSDMTFIGPVAPGFAIRIGSGPAITKAIVRQSVENTALGGAAIFIGLISLLVFFHRFRERVSYALTLGMFSLLFGLFTISFVPTFRLVFDDVVRYYLRFGSYILFPIFLYLFIERIVGSRVVRVLWMLHVAWAIVTFGLDVSGIRQYPELDGMTNFLLAATILALVVVGIREMQRGNPEARLFMVGLITTGLSGLHDILAAFGLIPFVHWFSPWGMLVFILCLVYVADRRFVDRARLLKVYSKELEEKSEQLEVYAHTLEERVRDRTRDLDEKNRALNQALRDLRDTQQQLVMREKMASLGNLVAGVAHEVNNPIGAVSSAADASDRCVGILSEYVGGGDVDRPRVQKALGILEDNIGIITTASQRVAEIVRSLRSFSRLDEAEFQEADIHDGLDSTLTLVHHKLKNRIDVVREYGDLPNIDCYPNQLNQVFMNILVNAAQAIDESGTIVIRTTVEGDHVVVSISDTGRGIAPDHLSRLFDPGFTTKGVGVGTGLGLSISYKIIERHGGRIEVESELGRGTTFEIRLPVRAGE